MSKQVVASSFGTGFMALLRMAIGWHFLYEGIVKLMEPQWSAGGYLSQATGPFAGLYRVLGENAMVLGVVSQLNVWALILIGACLLLGLFTRPAAYCGAAPLVLYFCAYIPLPSQTAAGPSEGHYLLVNKTLIELMAICVVAIFPARELGLDGLLDRFRHRPLEASSAAEADSLPDAQPATCDYSRRSLLKTLSPLPVAVPLLTRFIGDGNSSAMKTGF